MDMTQGTSNVVRRLGAWAVCCTFVVAIMGDEPKPAPATSPAASPAPAPGMPADVDTTGVPADLSELNWMVGDWEGSMGAARAFEAWSAPHAGIMMGVFHLYEGEQTRVMEFMTYRQRGAGIEMRFRHFAETLNAWEEKDQPNLLVLDRKSDGVWSFRNPLHDAPRRVTITRRSADAFVVDIEIVRGDETRMMQAEYKRVAPSAQTAAPKTE
jgi:hypothetical protein